MENTVVKERLFSPYQVFIIAVLTFLQFTVILDFMVLSPLGEQLMKELDISPSQFGIVVSAYALSAGASGLLAAGFADKFDRKKLLLFFYIGFIIGTLLCGLAPDYQSLLIARVVTGIFGGVIGSISFAIITDIFPLQTRGRVMGFVQMAFAASQILGIPIGLYLANKLGWHSPFLLIVGVSAFAGLFIFVYMKPVNAHVQLQTVKNPLEHLLKTVSKPRYLQAFAATALLATGGFMLMPFGTAFSVNNLGVDRSDLPMIFSITGLFSIITGPVIGFFSDKIGKYTIFVLGSVWSIIMVLVYTHQDVIPLWMVIMFNVLLFMGISARIISSSALLTAVPTPADRGAFMGVNASLQQISGGIAAAIAGLIVYQETKTSPLENYPILGYVVSVTTIITIIMMYFLNRMIMRTQPETGKPV
ncbi:MAG: MFS transporter [Cyclobacteriaceae bacterium]|jgi:predicted MFS family arabinose efflux permease|nr:MFS transporter [Cyclobacteriaceae bacterium]